MFRFRGEAGGAGPCAMRTFSSERPVSGWMFRMRDLPERGRKGLYDPPLSGQLFVVIEGKCRASRHVMGAHDVQIEKLP